MAKRKRTRLGEIKRTGRRRTQAQKATYREHRQKSGTARKIAVTATIQRDSGAIGSRREGDFTAEVCIPQQRRQKLLTRRRGLKRGYAGRCADGGGRTPTAALRNAFKKLGKTLE